VKSSPQKKLAGTAETYRVLRGTRTPLRCTITPAIVTHQEEVRPVSAVSVMGAPLQVAIARLR
jgi:hypothetical protein